MCCSDCHLKHESLCNGKFQEFRAEAHLELKQNLLIYITSAAPSPCQSSTYLYWHATDKIQIQNTCSKCWKKFLFSTKQSIVVLIDMLSFFYVFKMLQNVLALDGVLIVMMWLQIGVTTCMGCHLTLTLATSRGEGALFCCWGMKVIHRYRYVSPETTISASERGQHEKEKQNVPLLKAPFTW